MHTCESQCEEVVHFPDPNLEQAVRDKIYKPTGYICASDLIGLTHLDADSQNISNLGGLEHCTDLEVLSLELNQITDISPRPVGEPDVSG